MDSCGDCVCWSSDPRRGFVCTDLPGCAAIHLHPGAARQVATTPLLVAEAAESRENSRVAEQSTITVTRVGPDELRLLGRAVADGIVGDATWTVRRGEDDFALYEPHVGHTVTFDEDGILRVVTP